MTPILAVFFDADGVLLDSLGPHLLYCETKNREYSLGLRIPDAPQFRELVRKGVVVSPMEHFFVAVGFPPAAAARADADYQREFMAVGAPKPFPGVDEMLSRLAERRLALGIATSNTRDNVASALGHSLRHFNPSCLFTKDDPREANKRDALRLGAGELGVPLTAVIYVGDQPADSRAAAAAGTQFLGVTYGWGIAASDSGFPTASSPSEVAAFILERSLPEQATR